MKNKVNQKIKPKMRFMKILLEKFFNVDEIKLIIKKYLPFILIIYKIYKNYTKRHKIINNYFKTQHSKNALLSYITHPFAKGQYFFHTNYFEAMSHAKILNELGYNVDVIDYEYQGKIDFSRYDLLVGFGDAFNQYFESGINKKITTIYYGTGMHVCHQNHATLKRLKDVYLKKGIWLSKSIRYVEKCWTYQTYLVDAMIILGNEISIESYKKFYDGKIFNIPAPFYKVINAYELIKNSKNSKSFLWFGSSGLVHKGLDLLLDFFSKRQDLRLHICGPIKNEPDFEKVYYKELYETSNIITHGLVDIRTEKFKKILEDCSFLIFPSCSEGCSPSVITAIGNGGLIPIITKETTVSTGYEIWIEDFTVEAIEKAVNRALSLTDEEISQLRKRNLEYVLQNHTTEVYYQKLKEAYIDILGASK
jgi:glycosyltransferase involved in cell wall biosynthesis